MGTFDSVEGMQVLFKISALIRDQNRPENIYPTALGLIRDSIGCSSASLFICNPDSDRLEEVATVGTRVDLIEAIDFDMGKGFSAWVAKQRRSVLIPVLRSKSREGFRSFISTPLISAEKLIGVLNLGHEETDAFNERHMKFLDVIGNQLAFIFERSSYENKLLDTNNELVAAQRKIQSQQKKIIEMEKTQVAAQFAASINHEINNPLTTILGNLELLMMTADMMDEKIVKRVRTIEHEAKRIADIVEKMSKIKKVVTEDYLTKYGDKMIDLDSSSS